jgi:PAS domain S-box-containing protein
MIHPTNKLRRPGQTRILAVDDNPAALYATSRVLRAAGFEVIEASTGAQALAKATQADLIVLDVNLPDIDGFEVCRRLRARPDTARIPLLHLSATFINSTDLAMGAEAGADSYLTRPVEAPVLIATVRTLLFAKHSDAVRQGSDAKLRTVFDLAPIGIAILDQNFTYTSVNPAYCKMTGFEEEELLGRPITFSLAANSLSIEDFAKAAPGDAGHWSGQLEFEKKDGGKADFEWEIAREDISSTRILISSDVSQRSRNQAARDKLLASERAARAEAERSNRAKEEFLATLSHELRNPLHAIVGWATILNKLPNLPEAAVRGLRSIERNSKIQARMIADILDYASITFGKIRSIPENIDPYAVVRAAIEVISDAALSADVRLKVSFEDTPLRIFADPARLQQIVLNLLTNAVKFSAKGGEVTLTAGRAGDCFSVVVSDQGKGIEPQFLPRLFDRFSQQDATITKAQGGLGLGLAIVKQLVELHGGTIEAASEGEGRGATFKLMLPLSDAQSSADLTNSRLQRLSDFSTISVLIVDDDADSRALTARVLSDEGAKVVEADSADAALAKVDSFKPTILISDIGMANLDGYQLLRALRDAGNDEESMPAIALTAFSRMEDRAQALAAGFQEHLVKPLDPQMLISTVLRLCSPRRPPN